VTVDAPARSTVVIYDGSRIVRSVTVGTTRSVRLPKLAPGRHAIRAFVVSGEEYTPAWSTKVNLRVSKKK
jgi:amidase